MQKITLLSMLLVLCLLVISYIPKSESSEKFPENVDLPKNNQSLTAQLIEKTLHNMPQGEVHLRPKRTIIKKKLLFKKLLIKTAILKPFIKKAVKLGALGLGLGGVIGAGGALLAQQFPAQNQNQNNFPPPEMFYNQPPPRYNNFPPQGMNPPPRF